MTLGPGFPTTPRSALCEHRSDAGVGTQPSAGTPTLSAQCAHPSRKLAAPAPRATAGLCQGWLVPSKQGLQRRPKGLQAAVLPKGLCGGCGLPGRLVFWPKVLLSVFINSWLLVPLRAKNPGLSYL